MAKNEIEPKNKLLIFSIAFDTESKAATFAGSMPVNLAAALIQQVVQSEARNQMRKEVEAEVKKQKTK